MKLCFSTLPCPGLSYTQIAELCKKYCIPAIEIRETKDIIHTDIDVLAKRNIKVSDIAAGVCIKRWDEKTFASLCSSIDFAAKTGAPAVRVFLGNFYKRIDEPRQQLDHNGIVKMLKTGCEYAFPLNVKLWVETHNEYSTGYVLKQLINDVNNKSLGIIWDIMHPLEEHEDIEQTYALIGKYIEHIHIKDGKPWDNKEMVSWKYTPVGEGEVPIKDVIKLLNRNNYNGYCSLEWENAWRDELKKYPTDMDWILSHFINCMNLANE